MVNLKSFIIFSLSALAIADTSLEARAVSVPASVVCGSTSYSVAQLEAATNEGCRLRSANLQLGSSKYPHRFNNREALVLIASGPYQEFPILSNKLYDGGSPGADRIVFKENMSGGCVYAGAMTHTGAPDRNGFVLCESSSGTGSSQTASTTSKSSSSSSTSGASAASATSTSSATRPAAVEGLAVVLGAWAGFVML